MPEGGGGGGVKLACGVVIGGKILSKVCAPPLCGTACVQTPNMGHVFGVGSYNVGSGLF